MKLSKDIPILIDFDGVIRIGKKTAKDAWEFFKFILDKKIPACILSNSTLRNGKDIKKFLSENNIKTDIPVLTCADASLNYVKENYKKIAVFASVSTREMFNEYLTDNNPEAVLVGDLSDKWSYEILNQIFRFVLNGADLIAMQKNKYWSPDDKNLFLDAGAFISAIEYATGKEAKLIGKPSPIFYHSGLKAIGFPENSEFVMVGDDIETDIDGAQKIGGKGILIYTGKAKYPLPEDCKTKPFAEIQTLTEIKSFFD
ncbi:MAG: HAD hydrolase-like protein [Ignavibacteriaceae bacterium]|jgi:HAD superfamily hydrolase (TIGR01458 family)